MFNNIIKKRVKSQIGFSVEKTKKNVYDSIGKLKTISIKTQRIYKRKSKAKIMSNEMISKICKNVLEIIDEPTNFFGEYDIVFVAVGNCVLEKQFIKL